MRAVLIAAPGAADNLSIVDAPSPGLGEVLIDVAFCGCNFADTMIRSGTYPHPKGYPIVAGLEIAGRVAALGEGVASLRAGDRVAFSEEAGGFADQCVVPAERVIPVPDGMGLNVAAAFPIQGLTSWHLLHSVSVTKPGDAILLHAIGGGVGLFATQLTVKAGATVIGTVGTRGKEKRPLQFGAAKVVNREDEDFVAVMDFTGGRGVDKIVEFDRREHPRPQLRGDPKARPCGELRRSRGAAVSQSLGAAGVEVAYLHALSSRPRRFRQ